MAADTTAAFVAANWIPDTNRFNLPVPPQWWLTRLYDFDHMLVVIPSRFQRQYLLARRRQFTAGLGDKAMLDNKHPDTNMLMVNGLLPVAPLRFKNGTPTFTMESLVLFLDELRSRDLWAQGKGPQDAEAIVRRIEEAEAAQEAREHRSLYEGFRERARDAWRSLQARTGQRNKRASDYHGHAKAPTGGGIITP